MGSVPKLLSQAVMKKCKNPIFGLTQMFLNRQCLAVRHRMASFWG